MRLPDLTYINIGRNMLDGPLPENMGDFPNPEKMTRFILFRNHLTGPIPKSLCKMTMLELLYIGENRFTGTVPDCFASLTELAGLDLADNLLTGPLPDIWDNFSKLKDLWLNRIYNTNLFTGPLPPSFGEMKEIKVIPRRRTSLIFYRTFISLYLHSADLFRKYRLGQKRAIFGYSGSAAMSIGRSLHPPRIVEWKI